MYREGPVFHEIPLVGIGAIDRRHEMRVVEERAPARRTRGPRDPRQAPPGDRPTAEGVRTRRRSRPSGRPTGVRSRRTVWGGPCSVRILTVVSALFGRRHISEFETR